MLIYQNRKKIVNKKVLIAVDVNDQHVELFKEAASGKCDFVIKPMAELTLQFDSLRLTYCNVRQIYLTDVVM